MSGAYPYAGAPNPAPFFDSATGTWKYSQPNPAPVDHLPFDDFNPIQIREALNQGATTPSQVADLLRSLNGGDLTPLEIATGIFGGAQALPLPPPIEGSEGSSFLPYDNFNPTVISQELASGATNPERVRNALDALNGGDYTPLNRAMRILQEGPVTFNDPPSPLDIPPGSSWSTAFSVPTMARAISSQSLTAAQLTQILGNANAPQWAYANLREASRIAGTVPPQELEAYLNLYNAAEAGSSGPTSPQDSLSRSPLPSAFDPTVASMARLMAAGQINPLDLYQSLQTGNAGPVTMNAYQTALAIVESVPAGNVEGFLSSLPGYVPPEVGNAPLGNIPSALPTVFDPSVASMVRLMTGNQLTPQSLEQSLINGRAGPATMNAYRTALTIIENVPAGNVEAFLSSLPGYEPPVVGSTPPQQPPPLNSNVDPASVDVASVAALVRQFAAGASTPETAFATLRGLGAPAATWQVLNTAAEIYQNVPPESLETFIQAYVDSGGRVRIPGSNPASGAGGQLPNPLPSEAGPSQGSTPPIELGPEPFNGFDAVTIANSIESGAVTPRLVYDLIQMYHPGSSAQQLTDALNILQHLSPPELQPVPPVAPPVVPLTANPFDNWNPEVIAETIRAGDVSPYEVFQMLRQHNQPSNPLSEALQILQSFQTAPVPAPAIPAPAVPVVQVPPIPAPAQPAPVPFPVQPDIAPIEPFQGWNPAAIANALNAGTVSEADVRRLLEAYGMGPAPIDAALVINAGRQGILHPPSAGEAVGGLGGATGLITGGEIAPWQMALIAAADSDDDEIGYVYDQSGRIISRQAADSETEDPESGRKRKDKGKSKPKKEKKKKGKERAREMQQAGPDTSALMKKQGPDSDEED
ncbi:hypothetical protein HDU93_010016 [Gonapodya sp. JEL0774]|nr:hypothetical protein HDU93_010016 [Gonapodya sp. JEL0774]